MSKFFNETRTVRKTDSISATANVNIQDLVSSLKEHMESNGAAASHSGQVDLGICCNRCKSRVRLLPRLRLSGWKIVAA